MSAVSWAKSLLEKAFVVMGEHFTLELIDEAATLQAGQVFSRTLQAGLVIYLHGDLGAGKTTFVRGILQGLGFLDRVKSPTYTLVEPYVISNYNIYHFDLYRFNDIYEWESAGFREYFNDASICIIEWPEKADGILPKPDIDINLSLQLPNSRLLEIIKQ